jgi:hypothetical protein
MARAMAPNIDPSTISVVVKTKTRRFRSNVSKQESMGRKGLRPVTPCVSLTGGLVVHDRRRLWVKHLLTFHSFLHKIPHGRHPVLNPTFAHYIAHRRAKWTNCKSRTYRRLGVLLLGICWSIRAGLPIVAPSTNVPQRNVQRLSVDVDRQIDQVMRDRESEIGCPGL